MDQLQDHRRGSLPEGWQDALDRADADIAAGRVVPSEHIMRKLRTAIAAMESKTSSDHEFSKHR